MSIFSLIQFGIIFVHLQFKIRVAKHAELVYECIRHVLPPEPYYTKKDLHTGFLRYGSPVKLITIPSGIILPSEMINIKLRLAE